MEAEKVSELKSKQFIKDIYDTFDTEVGKRVLGYFEDILRLPVADPNQNYAHAYVREGENNMIRRIFRCIDIYKSGFNEGESEDGSDDNI